jgi:hypothetical protein
VNIQLDVRPARSQALHEQHHAGPAGDSGLPGFVAGYWMARSAEQGLAVIVFDSQSAAQGFADFLKTAPDEGGVTLDRDSIAVAEVLAHA